ncbi:C25 family cysteine peptidase [Novipirellula artificiosorum]|uniref:Gingipain domain-containing protein n=1 Tax=Novipirellula artificiosorum TaxID=2528016 RepID=A0A5C6DA95_9BACT|nr:C25 family cysteine peptidase [Novipirellula artificiosorum]TWU31759.1 hypothetical protein Poly41_59940 [Novipirellula artificiosorum]
MTCTFRLIACLLLVTSLFAGHSPATDIVAVCPDTFRDSLEPWMLHRQRDGLSIKVIPSSPAAATLHQAIRAAADSKTRFVVLVGDCPVIGTRGDASRETPTNYLATTVTAQWGAPPTLSTDMPFGDFDQDGTPDAVVGRLPVNNPAELDHLVNRIIRYESNPDFGVWRGNVQLVGGLGGFGSLIDTAIESVTRTVVTGVLPAETRTFVAYASPNHRFCPKDQPFTDAVLADYRRGARFWVYAGHGYVTELDRVPATLLGRPVLDCETVCRLDRPASALPIALLLACYTGAIDAPEDCLAERMLVTEGGPIAVFAGSRVTMPYGNATAAIGLIDSVYEKKMQRLGDAWLQTQVQMSRELDTPPSTARMMIDGLATMISPAGTDLLDERREHVRLYNLLGDPALHLHPPQSVSLRVATGFDPGETISIDAISPIDGELTVTLHRPLGSVPDHEADPNATAVASITRSVTAEVPSQSRIVLPESFRGPLTVRAFVSGSSAWATSAAKTRIRNLTR